MNRTISVIFRLIPLAMAVFCVGYGLFILNWGKDPDRMVAGPVVTALGAICVALFCTAVTIIRQILGTYTTAARWGLPILGYIMGVGTIIVGLVLVGRAETNQQFVAAHVVTGIGFIACCVATAATSSTKFTLIPQNSKHKRVGHVPDNTFSVGAERVLESITVISAVVLWVWAIALLSQASTEHAKEFIAGHVVAGLAAICTCLIALVSTIVRQIRNVYTEKEAVFWPWMVLGVATVMFLWGLYVAIAYVGSTVRVIGFIVIGLSLVCFSISSKVILLAKLWWKKFPLANRIPMIPIFTALACCFLASFMFELATTTPDFFIPARVLMGLGAVCFTLFSIVSILESGAS